MITRNVYIRLDLTIGKGEKSPLIFPYTDPEATEGGKLTMAILLLSGGPSAAAPQHYLQRFTRQEISELWFPLNDTIPRLGDVTLANPGDLQLTRWARSVRIIRRARNGIGSHHSWQRRGATTNFAEHGKRSETAWRPRHRTPSPCPASSWAQYPSTSPAPGRTSTSRTCTRPSSGRCASHSRPNPGAPQSGQTRSSCPRSPPSYRPSLSLGPGEEAEERDARNTARSYPRLEILCCAASHASLLRRRSLLF